MSEISEEEKRLNPEFFLPIDRPRTKTPEKYLKIRNFFVNAWESSKPTYISKTKIRDAMRKHGNVATISGIHENLEILGLINIGVENPYKNILKKRKENFAKRKEAAQGMVGAPETAARTGQGQMNPGISNVHVTGVPNISQLNSLSQLSLTHPQQAANQSGQQQVVQMQQQMNNQVRPDPALQQLLQLLRNSRQTQDQKKATQLLRSNPRMLAMFINNRQRKLEQQQQQQQQQHLQQQLLQQHNMHQLPQQQHIRRGPNLSPPCHPGLRPRRVQPRRAASNGRRRTHTDRPTAHVITETSGDGPRRHGCDAQCGALCELQPENEQQQQQQQHLRRGPNLSLPRHTGLRPRRVQPRRAASNGRRITHADRPTAHAII